MAKDKKVLVVGGGGRCHAIVDTLLRSPQVAKVYCAPGNAGIALQAECVPIEDTDVPALLAFALEKQVDLTVVGPEASLARGIVDAFRREGLKIFGHTQAATRIESSKEFAKDLMKRYDIPTASYRCFSDYQEALAYVSARPFPAVLKYDGLAAGKGVVIAQDLQEADQALRSMLLDAQFGEGKVVVEDYLEGPEFSFMCFVSGEKVYPMPLSQDHKRAFDMDKGPNTGGMGAYTSLPFINPEDWSEAMEGILKKTASAMVSEGCPLSGVLYGGLMKTPQGIKVIEFNARFGDPETEVVLPLLESDAYELFSGIACNREIEPLKWKSEVTMGVVLASKGYPGAYQKGFEIKGLDKVEAKVFHMGTSSSEGKFYTAGGRCLMVVASAESIEEAGVQVYSQILRIQCESLFYRKDIAHWALEGKAARIIDGKALSESIKLSVKETVRSLAAQGRRQPCLAVIMVGNNPASQVYVRNKVKATEFTSMRSIMEALPEDTTQEALLNRIDALNRDSEVDGILVQLPLPRHIDESKVISAISKDKDVDGFHILNVGSLWLSQKCIRPCTPAGVIELIKSAGISIEGKLALVVGRSNIVGKPVAKLLLDENATVIMAHSRTRNLRQLALQADIIVAAVGKAGVISGDMVKKGAVVIDVGMNRDSDGRLCGDVDYASARLRASRITPVPGGVGPMTIAMLMRNTLDCYLSRENNE